MKRIIFITDIHSNYTKFINLLTKNKYNEVEDILILGGDYFDRGLESDKMAQWLIDNYKKDNVYLIRGNHDDFLIDLFNRKDLMYEFNCKNNGFDETIITLASPYVLYSPRKADELIQKNYPELKDVMNSLLNYVELGDVIYTHASLPTNFRNNTLASAWEQARWGDSFQFATLNPSTEKIAIGHWSLIHLPEYYEADLNKPFVLRNVIFCDGGMAHPNLDGIAFISYIE